LYTAASKGNASAANYLTSRLSRLGGGELEDAMRALGVFGDHDPVWLLTLTKNGHLPKQQLREVVTMMPLSLTDDSRRQLEFMRGRRKRIASVSRHDLQQTKVVALAAIDRFIVEIRSHM
jgi:hypothetical protein